MKSTGKKVLVTGVFDILHSEHIAFLKKAKALGSYLIIGIESDFRVREMKGPERPVNSQMVRKQNLENLAIADEIFILPEQFSNPEDHKKLIRQIKPDFLAVSSHTKYLDRKQAILDEFGGKVVVVHEHNPEISTTKLLSQS